MHMRTCDGNQLSAVRDTGGRTPAACGRHDSSRQSELSEQHATLPLAIEYYSITVRNVLTERQTEA